MGHQQNNVYNIAYDKLKDWRLVRWSDLTGVKRRRRSAGRRPDFNGKHHATDGAAREKPNLFELFRVATEEGIANMSKTVAAWCRMPSSQVRRRRTSTASYYHMIMPMTGD